MVRKLRPKRKVKHVLDDFRYDLLIENPLLYAARHLPGRGREVFNHWRIVQELLEEHFAPT